MYIPVWLLWTVGILVWLIICGFIGRPQGSYDFMSPLLGVIFFLAGLAVVGFIL